MLNINFDKLEKNHPTLTRDILNSAAEKMVGKGPEYSKPMTRLLWHMWDAQYFLYRGVDDATAQLCAQGRGQAERILEAL